MSSIEPSDELAVQILEAGTVRRAAREFVEGNYLNAARLLKILSTDAEKVAQVHYFLYEAYRRLGDNRNAGLARQTALELDPDIKNSFPRFLYDTYIDIGLNAFFQRRYQDAMKFAKAAETLFPAYFTSPSRMILSASELQLVKRRERELHKEYVKIRDRRRTFELQMNYDHRSLLESATVDLREGHILSAIETLKSAYLAKPYHLDIRLKTESNDAFRLSWKLPGRIVRVEEYANGSWAEITNVAQLSLNVASLMHSGQNARENT